MGALEDGPWNRLSSFLCAIAHMERGLGLSIEWDERFFNRCEKDLGGKRRKGFQRKLFYQKFMDHLGLAHSQRPASETEELNIFNLRAQTRNIFAVVLEAQFRQRSL